MNIFNLRFVSHFSSCRCTVFAYQQATMCNFGTIYAAGSMTYFMKFINRSVILPTVKKSNYFECTKNKRKIVAPHEP